MRKTDSERRKNRNDGPGCRRGRRKACQQGGDTNSKPGAQRLRRGSLGEDRLAQGLWSSLVRWQQRPGNQAPPAQSPPSRFLRWEQTGDRRDASPGDGSQVPESRRGRKKRQHWGKKAWGACREPRHRTEQEEDSGKYPLESPLLYPGSGLLSLVLGTMHVVVQEKSLEA